MNQSTPVAILATVLLALMSASSANGDGLDEGLVGLWEFDEAAGTAVADTSGNHNDGIELFPENKTPQWGKGELAGTLRLSATTNNHIQVQASPTINAITDAITIVATVKPQALWKEGDKGSGYTAIVQRQWQEVGHPDQYYLGYGQIKGTLYYKWHVGLESDQEVDIYALPSGTARPVEGEWVQIAGTYSSQTGDASLFVDGVAIATKAGKGPIRLDPASMLRPLVIGAEINGQNVRDTVGEFKGYLDQVRLYDRALSAKELAELATQRRTR